MRRILLVACASSLLPLTACGGGGSGNPAKPTPTAVSVSITPGDDFILIGESVQFSASVSLSDGSSSTQSGTWGSDAATVAGVDTTGKVTALAWGKATIYVDVQNHRGTRLVTVMPNFKGEWHGAAVLDACRQTGDFTTVDFCGEAPIGESDTIVLHVTQSRTTLTGTIDLAEDSGDLNGTVADDGAMTLTATIPIEELLVTIKNWTARSDTPGTMTGRFTAAYSAAGATGALELDLHLAGMVRTSGGPLSAEQGPGATSIGTLFNAARRLSVGKR